MRRSKSNRKIKPEIVTWIQSNLELILKLLDVSQKDFVALLGTSRQVYYNVLHKKDSMNGRWVLSIFYALDYICSSKKESGDYDTNAYEYVLWLIKPMARYGIHIDEIYED